jgi:hypothetical protein
MVPICIENSQQRIRTVVAGLTPGAFLSARETVIVLRPRFRPNDRMVTGIEFNMGHSYW